MQKDKEGLFDALDTWHDCLDMAALVLIDLKVNGERTMAAAQGGYANATELADYLVAKGIPFREAHHIVGETVVFAISVGKPLEELSIGEFQRFSPVIEFDVYPNLAAGSDPGQAGRQRRRRPRAGRSILDRSRNLAGNTDRVKVNLLVIRIR